jgi:hypothetical protein
MHYKILCLIACCSLLTGCPATMNVVLTNHSSSTISVLYSTGFESKIDPGEMKKENYNLACIRIKSSDHIYEFQPEALPNTYIDRGAFSSSISAVFTKENKIKIYSTKDNTGNYIELKQGC